MAFRAGHGERAIVQVVLVVEEEKNDRVWTNNRQVQDADTA